jgi:hypothetical protein
MSVRRVHIEYDDGTTRTLTPDEFAIELLAFLREPAPPAPQESEQPQQAAPERCPKCVFGKIGEDYCPFCKLGYDLRIADESLRRRKSSPSAAGPVVADLARRLKL